MHSCVHACDSHEKIDGVIDSFARSALALVASPALMRPSVAAGEPPSNERTSTRPSARVFDVRMPVCAYMYICTCTVYICTKIHAFMHTCMYIHTLCIFEIHVYIHVCVCMCVDTSFNRTEP
jgi:hypothetical protein